MHRTRSPSEEAAVSTIGTVLLTGLTVAMLLSAALLASNIQDHLGRDAEDVDRFSAMSRTDGDRHDVMLTSGSLPVDGTRLIMRADGALLEFDLSWFRDEGLLDDTWDPGEWICVSGDHPDCYRDIANVVGLTIYPPRGAALALGFLSAESALTQGSDNILVKNKRKPISPGPDGVHIQVASHVYAQVLGTELTSRGQDIPVTARISHDGGDTWYAPFFGAVERGDVAYMGVYEAGMLFGAEGTAHFSNPPDPGHDGEGNEPGPRIVICHKPLGEAEKTKSIPLAALDGHLGHGDSVGACGSSGSTGSGWTRTRDSVSNDPFVIVLTNGDPVPSTPGWDGQIPVGLFLAPLSDGSHIVLDDDEVLVLFELGTDNLSSPAADFQDLVLLFTFSPDHLESIVWTPCGVSEPEPCPGQP